LTFDFQSELEDVLSLQPNILEQGSSRDDLLSQVLGKDRNGYARTYGKGVVPSDLWGTKSQVEIQKTIEEVKRNAQVEIQILQERLQKEMEVKSKEQLEAFKSELLGGFNSVLAQIRQCFPEIVIPDLFSIPNINDVQGGPQSSASTHLTGVDPNKHTKRDCKKKCKSKEHKTKKVKIEKDPNILEHPPKSFSLLFDQDFENNGNRMAVIAWKSLSNEVSL
jgi:hypothetical protein